ncbi:DNA polymerase/3'-5' exonuclease PolX [Candidatus Solincola tengchongensis]|uniref:DNA polymerase/3'-5' exonuclease PolX n=1 Tax=Candidatus Solincola tengchongensis TaxID=2900693 RepID=UPI00257AD412|nr:DNA polymerase/3'-5' exonuclease PolX [Candidatus Solincola tengchongensis]
MGEVEELTRALEELAELSDIKGEVRFKVNAYHRAAEVVREVGEEILQAEDVKELRKYKGIGEGIAKKILEFKRTGTISKLEELKEEIPVELISLLQVPNLGPRRAKLVYDELGVRTIEELKEAAEAHKLAELHGLGPKAEQNILEGIRHLQTTTGRLPVHRAHRIQEEIIGLLGERMPGLAMSPAGSLRRMKETIGDIDILVASREPGKVMEAFCSLPLVERVLLHGDTKSSVLTTDGLQVDLRVVAPEEYGAALQYFTGSKPHNVRVREIAKKAGKKVSEYGVFRVKDNRRLAGADEEEVYAVLGMDCPPPELRENRGEVEAALEHRLPTLVSMEDIRGDLHVHTNASDGITDLLEMRAAAEALGYRYLAITDHAQNLKVANGLDRERLLRQVEEIEKLNSRKDSPVLLLAGTELNVGNKGEVDYDPEVLSRLDVVIAAVHGGFRQPKEQMTRRILEAIRNPHVKIVAHPTGRLIGQRPPYEVDLRKVMEVAAETGTALELNAFPDRLDLNDENLMEARSWGVMIALGTDAHRREHLSFMFYGVATARRGWLGPEHVLNAMEPEELLRWLWAGRERRREASG